MTDPPRFKYFPDPVGLKSIVPSENVCVVCKEARGYVYAGRPYGKDDYIDCICPWCIADGSAHDKLNVEFVDSGGIGGDTYDWDTVPKEVVAEIVCRTPGFITWQSEQWWTHCHDAGEFLAYVDKRELEKWGADAIEGFRKSVNLSGDEWEDLLNQLHKDGHTVGYLFRCLHCGEFGGYFDFT